jgi:hypothetical protein
MKFKVEVVEEGKITTYTADTQKAEDAVKSAIGKVGEFLNGTFKKEVYTKE